MVEWSVIWIAAVVSSIIGAGSLLHMSYIAHYWRKARGRVTDNLRSIAHHESGSGWVYFARIAFEAADGKSYTVRSDVGHQKPWTIGDAVTVHYKPGNPAHAMTLTFSQRVMFSGFFIIVALVCWGLITGMIERYAQVFDV